MSNKSLVKGAAILIVAVMLFALGAANLSFAQDTPKSEGKDLSSSEKVDVLIGFYQAPGPSERSLVRTYGGQIYREFTIVNVIAAQMTQKAADALSRNPKVDYVEPDGPVYALGTTLTTSTQTVPWGINRVFGDETYPFATWNSANKGLAVAVAILDSGIDRDHVDLNVAGGVNFSNSNRGNYGYDYYDIYGHGTHVAGTAAALGENLVTTTEEVDYVVGVAPDVALYAVKVLDDMGRGTISSIVSGIEWSVDNYMNLINMSFYSGGYNQTLENACNNAYNSGLLLVAAGGNNDEGDETVIYPAKYNSVIAVAASNSDDGRAEFSNKGSEIELIAPGKDIWSTYRNNSYHRGSGTSMASPHVAGTAALVWAANPDLLNTEIRQILHESAENLGLLVIEQGSGLVRADKAVALAVKTEPTAVGSIKGEVKGYNTDLIVGATVVVEGTDLSVTTGSDGSYRLEDVPTGEKKVTASAEGFYSQTATVTVLENETAPLNFTLQAIPTYTLSGTVNNVQNNPLEGVTVTIDETGQSDTTYSNGTYSISGVEEGTYSITASKDGYSSETTAVTVNGDTPLDFTLKATEDTSGLTIDSFVLTNTSNPAWARVTVEWTVSSGTGLASVKTEMMTLEGIVVDTETSTVSGGTASGTHELCFRSGHGKTYKVKLTVTDTEGKNISATKDIVL